MINGDPTKEQLEAVRSLYAPDADAERFNNLFISNPSWRSKVMGVVKGADLELYNSVNASLQDPTEDPLKKKEEEKEAGVEWEEKQRIDFSGTVAGFSAVSSTGTRQKDSETQEEPSEGTPRTVREVLKKTDGKEGAPPRGARISNGKLLPIQIAPEEQEVPQEGYQSVTDATQVVIPRQQDVDDRLSSEAYNKIMDGISEKRYQDIQDGRVNKVSTELSSSREIGKGQGMDFSFKMESPNGKVLEEESMSFEVPDGSTMEYFSTELTRFLASINPMQEESYIRRMESDPAYVQKVRELRGQVGKEIEVYTDDADFTTSDLLFGSTKRMRHVSDYTEKDFDREVEELREATIDGYREETREDIKEQVLSILPNGATEEEINALDDVLFEAGVALDLAGDGKYNEQSYGKDLAMSLASGLVQAAKPFKYLEENIKGGVEGLFSKDETIFEGIERRGSQFRKATEVLIDQINEERTIYHDGIVDSFSNGDYQNAFAQIGTSVVESLPITAEIIALNATGVGAGAVPWLIGGQVGVSTWMEVADDPTMSPEAKFGYVLSSAGAEAAFALVGTRLQMRAQMREMARAAIAGNTSARSTLKGIVQGMGIQRGINSMLEGGTEEFFIEFLNAMSKDIAMGNPFDFEKYFDAGLEASFVGIGSAGAFTAAGTLQGGLKAIRNNKENPVDRDSKADLEFRKLEIENAIREESNVTVKKALRDELNGVSRKLEQIEARSGDMVAIMLMNNSPEAMSMLSMMDQAAEAKRAYNNASTDVAKKALKDKYDKLQEDIKNTFEAFKDENPDDYREAIEMINNGWTPKEARLWQDVLEARREAAASKPNLSTVDSFVESELMGDGDFVHMTAENPNDTQLSTEENVKLNAELKEYLLSEGYDVVEIDGNYNRPEKSFYVKGMSIEDAVRIGKMFKQESVAHSKGLLYTMGENAGKMEPANGEVRIDRGDGSLDNYYSVMKTEDGDSVKYSIQYDLGNLVDIPSNKPAPGNRAFNTPLEGVSDIADGYFKEAFGEEREGFTPIRSIDKEKAKQISDAFEAMENNPNDPVVREAYEKLAEETIAQYQYFIDQGYVIEINNNEPYANSQEMINDLRDNKRMKIFSTESGFGDTPITDQQRSENPLLQDSGFKDANGEPLLINDLFRGIHDFFGHAELGNGFGPIGEENAWNIHARMFSPLARRAMTTETRGQNSYVNFSGVNKEAFELRDQARKLRKEGKIEEAQALTEQVYELMKFADQKIGLLPEEFSTPTKSSVEPPTEGRTETPKKKSAAEAEQAFADGTGLSVDEVRSEGFDPNNRTIEMAGFSLRNPFKKKKRVFRDNIKEETTIIERFNSDVDKFLTKTKRLWLQTFFSGSGLPKNISEKIREMQRQGDVLTDELKTDIILFKEIFEGADSKTMELLADFQSDTNPDSNKALMRESMTPEQLEVIYYMRGKIDRLSDKLIEHLSRVEGNEKLIETIQSNKGSYLLRSYRIFNDSKYIENITKDYDKMPASFKERYDNAINFVMEENNVGREVATNIVSEYITQVTDKGMSAITAGDLNVNKGSLTQRQMISEPFRELMGEVKDPILKYAQTVTNLTNMVNSMEYQQQLYQILKDMDIISDFKRKNSDTLLVGTERDVKREKMSTSDQVSIFDPERSRVEPTQRLGIEPLYGKYVNKEFKAAFDSMGPLKSVQEMDFMWRTIIKATSNTKYYKTVLSPTTTLRNIYSGMFLSIGAGHMPFTKNAWTDLGTAWGSKKSRKERQAERSKLISLGVLGDGASSGEVMALMKDISKDFSSVTGDMSRYKKMMEFTQRFYAIGDDFFKVSGFYQEKAALMKSGMTEAEAETKAAERIRNGYPTYSYLPKNMQKLRRNPFFGTFIAFPYESVRATKNNFKFAIEDMMAGRKAMAAKRIAGLAVSSLGFTVLANTIRDMFKLDEEDEAFLRFIAPEWQTNSQLLVLNNDKGELSYVDLSFMAPSATVVKPATALLKPTKEDRDPMDVFLEVTGEVVDPYTSVDLTAQTFTDLLNNTDEFGQKIYNGEAVSKDATNGATDMLANADVVLAYMSKKIGPGFMSNLSEFLRSNGLVEEYVGSELTKYKRYTNQEAVAALLGFRTSSVPIPASVSFKAMDLAQTMKDYKTMELNEVLDMESEVPLSDLVDVASEYIRLATEYNKNLHYLVESGSRLMDKGDAANSRKTLVTSMKGVTGISDYRSQLLKGEMPDKLMLPYPKDSKGNPRLTRVENVILKRMGSVWLDQLNQLQEDNDNYPSSFKANAKRFYDELPPEIIESINSRVFRVFFINEIVDQYNKTGVIPEAGSQFLTDGDRREIDKATKELFIKVLTKYGEKE